MKGKSRLILVLLAVVALVAIAVAATLVARGMARYHAGLSAFELARQKMEAYYRKNPFPSIENVRQAQLNAQQIRTEGYNALNEKLREGQIAPEEMTPGKFKDLFTARRRALDDAAHRAGVVLPDRFAFGFSSYDSQAIPKPEHVPRLTQQLKITEFLCNVLFAARIKDLTGVVRETFDLEPATESAPAAHGHARRPPAAGEMRNSSAGLLAPGETHGRLRFRFTFTAKESAILNVLSGMARGDQFVVVDRLELAASGTGVSAPAAARREAAGPTPARNVTPARSAGASARDDRVVSGREVAIPVTLDVSVYQFAEIKEP